MPEIFVGVLATTALAGKFGWNHQGLQVLGTVGGLDGSIGFPIRRGTLKYFNDTVRRHCSPVRDYVRVGQTRN